MLKQRFRLILLVTAVAVGLVVVPASAQTLLGGTTIQGQPIPTVDDVVSEDLGSSLSRQKSVLNHWTPERMRSATPVETPVADPSTGGLLNNVLPSKSGLPQLPATPGKAPSTATDAGQDADRAVETPKPLPSAAKPPVDKPETTPRSAAAKTWSSGGAVTKNVGKVFFTLGGKDLVCTAAVIDSQNRDTVITGGHCVNDGGTFARNWTFIPGYNNGNEPNGRWTARTLKALAGWTQNGDRNQDVGFAVLNTRDGRHIADAVGAQKIAFNTGNGAQVQAFGYPQYAPYNGKTLEFCSDTAKPDNRNSHSTSQGISCDMTEGSSGGMWAMDMQPSGIGTVVGVNSYSYSDSLDVMMSPTLGNEAKAAYDAASSSSAASRA
ncbi:MAG: trypsin-like serine peptidase [Mycobacteriales bacterium]